MDRQAEAGQAAEEAVVTALAIISGVSIAALAAIVLCGIRAVRATVRDVTPQLRMAPPAKQPEQKSDPYLAGPPFAGGTGGTQ